MLGKLRKIICYTLIFTLFNTSFQPLYAFPDFDKDVDISSPSRLQRMINPSLEAPEAVEADAVSKFVWNPLKGLLGATKSVIRHSFKPLVFLALYARGVDAGDEFVVPQNGTMSQNSPSLTSSNGIFILNYHGGDNNIYESHIFPNESITAPYQINDNTTSINTYASVTSWNNITFSAWQCSSNICGHTRYENGTTIRDTFLISDNTTSSNYFPYVTSAKGKVFTGWVGSPGAKFCGRISDINGTHISNVFKASNYTTLYQDHPLQFVWSSADGDFYPIWEGLKNGIYSIYENRVDPDGTVSGDEYLVGKNSTLIQNAPSGTLLLNGNSIKTYNVRENGVNAVKAKITAPNGSTIIEEFPVSPSSIYHQLNSIVTRLPRYILITWYGLQNGPNIYGRLLSEEGTIFLSDVFPVNQLPINNRQLYPYFSAAAHPNDGSALLAWTSNATGVLMTKLRLLTNDTLSSFLYPAPSPVPLPAPAPAQLPSPRPTPSPLPAPRPVPVFAPAPLPGPVTVLVPAPVPSPILTPSPSTQSSSGAGSLSSSEFSTYMLTPSSSSLLFSSSSTVLMDSSSSSPSSKTTAIIGGAVGGSIFLIAAVVGGVLIKVCCFSGGDKPDEPESSPVDEEDVEEKEKSSSSSSLTGSDRLTLTNVTEKLTKNLTKKQRNEQYVDFARLSNAVNDNPSIELSSVQAE